MELVVQPKEIIANPDPQDLKKMVGRMANATLTEFGNYNVATRVVARSKASTYIVTERPDDHTDPTLPRHAYEALAQRQDAYIAGQAMIVIDGFIGPDPATRTAARLMVEQRNANIAAMQQQLYFTPTAQELQNFTPELNVIYTPNLPAPGFPNDRLIAVDLENRITRVFNSDYFGESKKGGLRMWNKLIYDRGGLAMHAGCKVIPVGDVFKTCLIVGLSGTGKTTTTFSRQHHSRPVQDDFIALLPDGSVLGTENGCFAKTFGLTREAEPMIYDAVTRPEAYLENVSVDTQGKVNFHDDSYTQNGRATFPFALIPEAGSVQELPPVSMVLILNRNENIIPAVARLNQRQAAAYFALGETQGTSAGGVEEAGKSLRVPGTNPFFPLRHGLQGMRFLELAQHVPMEVYLMNTGWVGGAQGTEHSRKVKIRHSSAIVEALAKGTVAWKYDPDFGYETANGVPGIATDDHELLEPRALYARTQRLDAYQRLVERLKQERSTHLNSYSDHTAALVQAIA